MTNWEYEKHKRRYMRAFLDFTEMTRVFQADSCSKERRDYDSLYKKRGFFKVELVWKKKNENTKKSRSRRKHVEPQKNTIKKIKRLQMWNEKNKKTFQTY